MWQGPLDHDAAINSYNQKAAMAMKAQGYMVTGLWSFKLNSLGLNEMGLMLSFGRKHKDDRVKGE